MKRLERLGSVAFVTVLLALIFHLLAMSYKSWIQTICKDCQPYNALRKLDLSLNERCYEASLAPIFTKPNQTADFSTFRTTFCMPNQFLFAKDKIHANYCLAQAIDNPDIVCGSTLYNTDYCGCDVTVRTKVSLAMTIIAALCLGVMIFFSHLISFIEIDYILNWLIPVCFGLLTLSIVCITVAISVMGALKTEDILELRYQWSLYQSTLTDVSVISEQKKELVQLMDNQYSIKIGWSTGLEIMALYFCVVSLVLYTLMFIAKKRPESKPRSGKRQQTESKETNTTN